MLRAGVLMVTLASGACAAPNLVLPTGDGAGNRQALNVPSTAQFVSVAAADGAELCGVWVPAAEGAPIVLQLMESTVGATEARRTHGLFWDFPAAGYATLAFDYRGVAASGGKRSSEHLRDDARAMWKDAVARADGEASRVILRGGSLGALAIATLLQDGVRPGAVVLYGPVRAETVTRHFMVTGWADTPKIPDALAPWVALLFRKPLAVDLVEEVARCSAPILVICGAQDELLPLAESTLLRDAAAAAGGAFLLEDHAHVELCTRHHRLHEEERAFLAAVAPVTIDQEARFRAVSAELAALGAPRLTEESSARLRTLLATRLEDPPAVLAGLLAAGFPVQRMANWLDADRAARGRWLTDIGWAEVSALAGGSAPREDPVLFALVQRIWNVATPRASTLMSWGVQVEASSCRLRLLFENPASAAVVRVAAEIPADDLLHSLEALQPGTSAAAQLQRLVRIAAAGVAESN